MTPAPAAANIRWWMIGLNVIIVAILVFKTWACFFDPAALFGATAAYEPAHVKALWELAGRNLAMIGLSAFAMLRPTAARYQAVFIMGLLREGADMVFAAGLPPESLASLMKASPFLIFLVLYLVALLQMAHGSARSGITFPAQ